jgi:soluble lytic murein transglycosylase-like protein
MSRKAFSLLFSVVAIGLSCERPLPNDAALPPVSAAPPVLATSPTAPPIDAALVERIAARMRAARRITLTDSEIVAVARAIAEESRRQSVDPALVLAVIHVESRFDAYAVSSVGAMGLMQILPSTGAELAAREGIAWRGPRSLFDPVANVRLGIAYLKELSDRYGDTAMALAAYNWGPGHIDRRLERGTPMPTVYPTLVFEAYSRQRQRSS